MAQSSRQIARKHHYVPQMYLSGFTDEKGQCFAVDASTRASFRSAPEGISAKRDYNLIEAPGVPPDALEKELGNFEGVIAPGIKRIRETASFGENGKDREDVINLITLLAVRNPRTRKDMEHLGVNVLPVRRGDAQGNLNALEPALLLQLDILYFIFCISHYQSSPRYSINHFILTK